MSESKWFFYNLGEKCSYPKTDFSLLGLWKHPKGQTASRVNARGCSTALITAHTFHMHWNEDGEF